MRHQTLAFLAFALLVLSAPHGFAADPSEADTGSSTANPAESRNPRMPDLENTTAEDEHLYHHYSGNDIPWYVRVIWVGFWAFAIYYSLRYALPMIPKEMVSPP